MRVSTSLRALAACGCLTLALAGCGSPNEPQSSPSATRAAAASDGGGPSVVINESEGDGDAPPVPEITAGGLDHAELGDSCSDEGMVKIPLHGAPDPALEGFNGSFTYNGWKENGGSSEATFTINQGGGKQQFGPLQVGDQFELGGALYSVTSICKDNAQLDVIG
ncbi:hypothetical protein [Dermabacter hominis]|uniref:hypothetical protein n=1 Tax=Dermabacter hominis TaxID=36740 RepID=UPI00242AF7CF|nr:hypothetical protein [Dermabacter hominis]